MVDFKIGSQCSGDRVREKQINWEGCLMNKKIDCSKCGYNTSEGVCRICGKTGNFGCWAFSKPKEVRRRDFEMKIIRPKLIADSQNGIFDWSHVNKHQKQYPHLFRAW